LDQFSFSSSQTTWELALLFEKMPKDLMQEVRDRKTHIYPWPESELMELYKQLISAFAYMQSKAICHRDIKPQNVLVSGKVLKVTDFGSSKQKVNLEDQQTVAGTPFFLSPKLKTGLLERHNRIEHNAYKSDVYSLGLTCLTMAKLEPPTCLATLKGLESSTEKEIAALSYSDSLKNLLRVMLKTEESERMDFLQLQEYLSGGNPQSPVAQMYCEHVAAGVNWGAYLPCHGYLCSDCFTTTSPSQGNFIYSCKLCVPKPVLAENIDIGNRYEQKKEENVGTFMEYKGNGLVCGDCKRKFNRSLLVPKPDSGVLLCSGCLGVYEQHYRQPYRLPLC
jgi:serine/threonine protein kinase